VTIPAAATSATSPSSSETSSSSRPATGKAGTTHRTAGSAGDERARALYARTAQVTGAIAGGFVGAPTTTAARATTGSSAAVASATSPTTRLSGVGLHLGATSTPSLLTGPAAASTGTFDLFADLRSALNGFDAQTGFDQLLATQLLGFGRGPRTGAEERLEGPYRPL
jgi:hypothetical protein